MKPEIFQYGINDQNTIRFDYIVQTHLDLDGSNDEQVYLIIKMIDSQAHLEGADIERFFRQYKDWLKRG